MNHYHKQGERFSKGMRLILNPILAGLVLALGLGAALAAPPEPYRVKDINTATADSDPLYLTEVNGTLFFVASDGRSGQELWKSDSTEAGTVMAKDINPGGDGSFPEYLTEVNGTLFFLANDGRGGKELWALAVGGGHRVTRR